MSYPLLIGIGAVLLALDLGLGGLMSIAGVKPSLVLPFVVYIGLMRGPSKARCLVPEWGSVKISSVSCLSVRRCSPIVSSALSAASFGTVVRSVYSGRGEFAQFWRLSLPKVLPIMCWPVEWVWISSIFIFEADCLLRVTHP